MVDKELTMTSDEVLDYIKNNFEEFDKVDIAYNRVSAKGDVLGVDLSDFRGKPSCRVESPHPPILCPGCASPLHRQPPPYTHVHRPATPCVCRSQPRRLRRCTTPTQKKSHNNKKLL